MSGSININQDFVESYASGIRGVASYFEMNPLVPYDGKSTISANGKGQCAYYKAQDAIAFFGGCLEQEAVNIRSLGAAFAEYDNMLTTLWESGSRYPMIQAPQ